MSISQDGMPPYTMTCSECGKVWLPKPARGKDAPTDASLDREAKRHFAECRGS